MAKLLRFLAWTSLIVAASIGLLRLTVIRWWRVPLGDPYLEASIAPSLRGGDWILLWRGTEPRAGDLILCPEPKAPNRDVIGRIVGEANDHVKLSADGLRVNRRSFETESYCDRFSVRDPSTGQQVEQNCRAETVGNSKHLFGDRLAELTAPGAVELDVPSGQVFLVSDNRQFPWDSRDFGPVVRDTCLETVIFRLISKDGFFDVANRLMLIR